MIPTAALIDINVEKDAEIHTDFMTHEFGNPQVQQLLWGSYRKKPVAQMDFDRLVIKACRAIDASDDPGDHDFRPRVKDLNTGLYFLIDTGASISVFPKHLCPDLKNAQPEVHKGLKAINGSKITTFGTKTLLQTQVQLVHFRNLVERFTILAPTRECHISHDLPTLA